MWFMGFFLLIFGYIGMQGIKADLLERSVYVKYKF